MLNLPDNFALMLHHVRLEPLSLSHADDLVLACQDGNLGELVFTSTPTPDTVADYINLALATHDRMAFAVIDEQTSQAIGTTGYHDILPRCQRADIGFTWYAQSYWRTHINTACKLMLLTFAFEALNYQTVGFRTDIQNTRSQAAIERLGAKKEGVIRGNRLGKDGVISDTVMYSITKDEWVKLKPMLEQKLQEYR